MPLHDGERIYAKYGMPEMAGTQCKTAWSSRGERKEYRME